MPFELPLIGKRKNLRFDSSKHVTGKKPCKLNYTSNLGFKLSLLTYFFSLFLLSVKDFTIIRKIIKLIIIITIMNFTS